jgi:single-strand selective monofunctional uracil DNA glycosylase
MRFMRTSSCTALRILDAARDLSRHLAELRFAAPVAHVYDPWQYAWSGYEQYVQRYGNGPRRLVLLGMNPGPFGMMQTGVPFGEIAAVRDWMGIVARIQAPNPMHPKRPITGFDCTRSEVSGRRLWGWASAQWGSAEAFFSEVFVLNYCPLVWLEASGRNRTPEQLPRHELAPVELACDRHLWEVLEALEPVWAIGIGGFAHRRLQTVLSQAPADSPLRAPLQLGQILHPSPASPAANRGWAEAVSAQLGALGIDCPGARIPAYHRPSPALSRSPP